MIQLEQEKNKIQFKAGDIVFIKQSKNLIDKIMDSIFLSNTSGIGLVISLHGELFLVRIIKGNIQLLPFNKEFKNIFYRTKIISPKKSYTKDEQDKISKLVIQSMTSDVQIPIKELELIAIWANIVRPRTFDLPTDVELSKYYKVIFEALYL
jgi:hypothetical protein